MPFEDRSDAGRRLAEALLRYRDQRPIVLALPRGGVAVAAEVATALDAPLDLILVRKIGVPTQPELAMGAVVDGGNPVVVRNADVIRLTGVTESEFKAICASELAEIERRRRRYLGDRAAVDVGGRTAIVIDDGIATGAKLREEVNEIVCLEDYEPFGAIGLFYDRFGQISDREVIEILARFAGHPAA